MKEFMMRRRVKTLLVLLALSLILTASSGLYLHDRQVERAKPSKRVYQQSTQSSNVLGVRALTPTSVRPSPTSMVIPVKAGPSKDRYRIALFGDSFIDTMGESMEALQSELEAAYPDISFELYNYGIGAQNVKQGLSRFNDDFNYQTRQYDAVSQIDADVIIVGSFSYNPFSPHDVKLHKTTLSRLVKAAQATGANTYVLSEIAPLREEFGRGPKGVNFSPEVAYEHSAFIIEQLASTRNLAKTLRVPLIDTYTPSLNSKARDIEGRRELVNADDGIHPSEKGHEMIAQEIVETVILP